MNFRQNTLLKQTGSSVNASWATNYTVTAYPVGAVVVSGVGDTATVHAGHSFRINDKALIGPGGVNTITVAVSAVTPTTITFGGGSYTWNGDTKLVNLGPDTGTSSPNYDGSPMWIFSDPYGTTAITNARVTCSSLGEYEYWHRGDGRFWELVRDSGGTVVDVIAGFGGVMDRLNIVDYGAKGNNSTNALTRIQAAVDAAAAMESLASSNIGKGISVFVPHGRFVVNGSIVLPKAEQSTHPRVVNLIGQSKTSSYITGGSGFSSGDAVIEWEQTTFKLWDQHIENLTITPPSTAGTYAILYSPSLSSTWAEANAEACTINLCNVEIECANQYHPSAIKMVGIARNCRFVKVFVDPSVTSRVYDTMAFEFDRTPYNANANAFDEAGCNFGFFSHIWVTPQRGGYGGLVKGRCSQTLFENCEIGVGNYDDPVVDLENSVNVEFRALWSEGRGETPQILLTDCRFVRFTSFMLGHPNQPSGKNSPWAGNGIEMVACTDCFIERSGDDVGFTSWQSEDTGTLKVLTLDANCKRNRIIMSDDLDAPVDFANEITDSGTDNFIELVAHSDDRYLYRNGPIMGSLLVRGDRAEQCAIKSITESITLGTGAATTDSSTNLLPANSLILGVLTRVTTAITTAVSFTVGDSNEAARFASGGVATDNSTLVGLLHWHGGVATNNLGPVQIAAAALRITCNATPGAGVVRATVFYMPLTAPSID